MNQGNYAFITFATPIDHLHNKIAVILKPQEDIVFISLKKYQLVA